MFSMKNDRKENVRGAHSRYNQAEHCSHGPKEHLEIAVFLVGDSECIPEAPDSSSQKRNGNRAEYKQQNEVHDYPNIQKLLSLDMLGLKRFVDFYVPFC